ncbi:MAG: hypothetical protein U0354_08835 [Candidatus Sericytochromatia bacterium]
MNRIEQERQKVETGDVPNGNSVYSVESISPNVEFGTAVRAHPYVRSFNINSLLDNTTVN